MSACSARLRYCLFLSNSKMVKLLDINMTGSISYLKAFSYLRIGVSFLPPD